MITRSLVSRYVTVMTTISRPTTKIITLIFSVVISSLQLPSYFTWDAVMRVGSTLNRPRSSTSVRPSRLVCLSSLALFTCSPSVSFRCIAPLRAQLCSAQAGNIDVTTAFPGYQFAILQPV